VAVVRNGKPFHAARTRQPWLRIPNGVRFSPGTYRWSVQPAVEEDSGIVLRDAVLVRTFRVTRG
jgi:hypothetical protein